MKPHPAERGFTLAESLVALALFLFGVALATQLLLETSIAMRDLYARDLETPLGLVRARLRTDLEAARTASCLRDPESGAAIGVRAAGHPAGTVVYQLEDSVLWRFPEHDPAARARVLAGIETLACADGGGLVGIELAGRRRALRRTPLATAPAGLPPGSETWIETLWVVPRGAGLGASW